ncbi:MAG TPA: carbamoyltransferase N-terminal domain-containing protein [Longimicrobiaceae bacterium]|nr:carbamoyltransferase N-terminal domain-containing protein [Longimicrobiaceae bacterium]
MHILGISCFYHDAAAALVRDGVVVAAAEEERFSRRKHDPRFPRRAVDFCLEHAGIAAGELDYVVFYEKPLVKFERILTVALRSFPRSWRSFGESMIAWLDEKLWVKAVIQKELGIAPERILFTDHHTAHAASAFFCSPFPSAAVLTVDGVGEWTTSAAGTATAAWGADGCNTIQLTRETRFPHSLGLLYSAFTAWLGFEVNEGEYKVMGMAPYGEPKYQERVRRVVQVAEDGSFRLDMHFFAFHYSSEHTYSPRFVELFGPPRDPRSEFFTRLTHPGRAADPRELERNQYYADVAASIQRVVEDTLVRMAAHLRRSTGETRLCMAGGVALNSVANGRILREAGFEELYVQPAAGDAGGAVGAALYVHHVVLGMPRAYVMEHAYLGREYGEDETRAFLDSRGVRYEVYDDEARMLDRLVDDLVDGRALGWSQGRFEWGPRALGNRSILADPRSDGMKAAVNEKIKLREPFRPFAPAILEDRASDFFEGIPDPERHWTARFMLAVLPWKEAEGRLAPAVNHLGTGRLQTVRREWNPRYHGLISRFGEATGVPVLMNTSFNLRGEPIVATPADAFGTFSRSGLDVLVLGNVVVRR